MRPCFKFTAKTTKKPAVLSIDEEIGFWGVQAKDFRAQLEQVADNDLTVEINSIGGDVFAGLGMYNMLRSWAKNGKTVTTKVNGLAASIASIVALAGDRREMPKNTFAMVHQPATITAGTADSHREAADMLDKVGGSMRDIYVDRMGISAEKADEIMAKDTWLTADECKDIGFATQITDGVTATAKFDMVRAELPAHVAAIFKASAELDPEEVADPEPIDPVEDDNVAVDPAIADQVAALVKTAGLEAFSASIVLASTSVDDAKTRISSAREIVALCAIAGRPDDAKAAISTNKTVADVRASLIKAKAESDEHTDNTKRNQGDASRAGSGVNPQQVWNSHNAQKTRPKKGSK